MTWIDLSSSQRKMYSETNSTWQRASNLPLLCKDHQQELLVVGPVPPLRQDGLATVFGVSILPNKREKSKKHRQWQVPGHMNSYDVFNKKHGRLPSWKGVEHGRPVVVNQPSTFAVQENQGDYKVFRAISKGLKKKGGYPKCHANWKCFHKIGGVSIRVFRYPDMIHGDFLIKPDCLAKGGWIFWSKARYSKSSWIQTHFQVTSKTPSYQHPSHIV